MKRRVCRSLVTILFAAWSAVVVQSQIAVAAPTGEPQLRTVAPSDALAYVRIPNLWTFLTGPTGNVLTELLATTVYSDSVDRLRTAFEKQILSQADAQVGPALRALLARMRSPLEALLLGFDGGGAPALLLSMEIDSADLAVANAMLRELVSVAGPIIQVASELDGLGAGALVLPAGSARLYFDRDAQRLYMLVEQVPSSQPLPQMLKSLEPNPAPPFANLESQIDQSGQGLFVWVDVPPLIAIGSMMMPAAQLAMIEGAGVNSIGKLAAGMGVSEEKGRIKLLVEMPHTGWRAVLPAMDSPLSFSIGSDAKLVGILGIPDAQGLQNLELLMQIFQPVVATGVQELREVVLETTGFSVEQWLSVLGPEIVGVADEAGEYAAIRLRDPQRWQEMLAALQARFAMINETREIAGISYSHLSIPLFTASDDSKFDAAETLLTSLFSPVPAHIYWREDNGYILLAATPQALIERDRLAERVAAGAWLRDTQKTPGEDAVFLVTGRIDDIPRMVYRIQLQVLQLLGDFLEQRVELLDFPLASDTGLPDQGALSFKVTSSQDQIGLEFVYEINPGEVLLAGGSTTLALAGIAAALAIPAYEDYSFRADVAGEITDVIAVRIAVEESYAASGQFPDGAEVERLRAGFDSFDDYSIEPHTGIITVQVDLDAGTYLQFIPQAVGGSLNWTCESDIEERYLRDLCGP